MASKKKITVVRTMFAPEDTSTKKLTYMPTKPARAPIVTESTTTLLKLLVSRRAVIGGMTMAAAINVTPMTCIETTIVPANIRENSASILDVRTP